MPPLILIVDDSPDASELTEIILSKIDPDIRTERFSSGEQTLDFLKKSSKLPAMILLDLKMPGIGGIETLRRIRADKRLKDVPVIMVTFSIHDSDIKAALDAGATGFVPKETTFEEFRKGLEQQVNCYVGK